MTQSASGTNPGATTVALSPISLSGSSVFRSADGSLNIIHVADNRGTGSGWTVTGQLQGNFVNNTPVGKRSNNTIAASNLLWLPSLLSGSATGVTAGPSTALSKTVARVLCSAPSGHGVGRSSCTATLKLAVPPSVAAGKYTAILDLVIS
jgi:hypothetical protein